MAGLKATQLADNPVAFWSFDDDLAGANGNQIIDEINNQNPLTVVGDKYSLEQQSLNNLETTDQFSCTFAKDGKYDTDWTDYNTYFTAGHSTAFGFPNLGSFTIEFLYYKTAPNGTIRTVGNPGYVQDMESPIIRKGSVITCRILDDWSSADYFRVTMFGNRSISINVNDAPIYDNMNHVIITYDVTETDINEYQSQLRLYINGKFYGSNTAQHVNTTPVTNTPDSWLIGGTGNSNILTSFNTEHLAVDQIAVYEVAFDETMVSNHYRKTKHYDEMIKVDEPTEYWRMDELDIVGNAVMATDISGGHAGGYAGTVTNHITGPEKLIESHAARFTGDGVASVTINTGSNPIPVISLQDNYTVEFWFKSSDATRAPLLSCVEENSPWDGLVIYLNSSNNAHSPGNVQLQENEDRQITSRDVNPDTLERENWNDGEWHYLLVRRNGMDLELWLDGEKNAESSAWSHRTNSDPSQLHLMGVAPGNFNVNGDMCELAYYEHSLQDIQIMHRWLFTTRYKIEGFTLLQGNPVIATVRFYDHITGQLVGDVQSDSLTGEYVFYSPTNRYTDVLSFIPDSNTTRYRVHGPVKPAEYDDSHLTT